MLTIFSYVSDKPYENSQGTSQFGQSKASEQLHWQYDGTKISAVSHVPAVAPPQDQLQQAPAAKPTGSFLNFDNPTVKKALDSLIQSGPNLLQSVLGNKRPAEGNSTEKKNEEESAQISAKKDKPMDDGQRPVHGEQQYPPHQQQPYQQQHSEYQDQYPQQQQGSQATYGQYNQGYPSSGYDQASFQYQDHDQFRSNSDVKYNKPQQPTPQQGHGVRHPLLGTPVPGQFSADAASKANRSNVLSRNMRSSHEGFF